MFYCQLMSVLIMLMIGGYAHGNFDCSLNCGNTGGQCVKTKIPDIPEICACPNGTFTNSTCTDVVDENENTNSSTSIDIHGRRLVAVCEHSFCGDEGVCIVIDSTFGCICSDGGISQRCTTYTEAPGDLFCASACLNDGVCNPIAGACVCPSGFSGTRCEMSRSTELCRDVTCRNGGVCNVLSPNYVACWCLLGFHGDYCERRTVAPRCIASKCYNGGTCYEHSPASSIFAYCLCRPGFTGSRCESEYFRCPNNGYYSDKYGCAQGKYFECVERTILISRSCPRGLRYNPFLGRCDYAANVNCPAV